MALAVIAVLRGNFLLKKEIDYLRRDEPDVWKKLIADLEEVLRGSRLNK